MSSARLLRILPGEPTAAMKEKAIDELWKGKLVENYAKYDENESTISPTMEDQKRFSNNDHDSATDPLISDMTDEENLPNRSELECSSKAEDFIHGNENEPKNSAVSSTSALDLFETDTNVYTDKNITECELPELVMSSKEVNYHIVKDICVDDGTSKEEMTAGGGLTGSCLEYTKDVAVNECGTDEGEDGKSVVPIGPKSASEISFDKDTPGESDPRDSIKAGVMQGDVTSEVKSDLSEKGSFVNNMLPMQEFGSQSFHRSFVNSINGEENDVSQPLDQQIPSGEASEKVQSSNLSYNSKMESENITFNLNSPKPAAACSANESIDTVNEQSIESRDVHYHKDVNSDNLSDTSPVQCASIKNESTGNVREQRLKDENHDNSAATCSKDGMGIENLEKSPDHKDMRSEEQSLGQVLYAGHRDKTTRNAHDQALEMINTSKHVDGNLKAQWDEGESSFSAGDHVTYSGPIPFSGSLSLRSESSAATSTRSFAFPVLQPESNASPVRMVKSDRRQFRKHKDWRSGLLCCRF
ncbi:uncharacterized protein LOC111403312 isoform X1 [Olea europaea var. sylvestris]|uniref:uncharacterized protein LOC111403312 isoform X1 n=1 Tax=Olea europaea var. sylvestris TaxID=158386 RepID=UPI000C1D79BF|nr:uncharacterized protein LOC111403312 isoform X1 [Olea europaea var. sylvestris]